MSELMEDGPTNGEMTEDEKDTLIQVLCPGNVATSFTQTSGKSSTCNGGKAAASKSLVQEKEEAGEAQIEWKNGFLVGNQNKQIENDKKRDNSHKL